MNKNEQQNVQENAQEWSTVVCNLLDLLQEDEENINYKFAEYHNYLLIVASLGEIKFNVTNRSRKEWLTQDELWRLKKMYQFSNDAKDEIMAMFLFDVLACVENGDKEAFFASVEVARRCARHKARNAIQDVAEVASYWTWRVHDQFGVDSTRCLSDESKRSNDKITELLKVE